MKAIYDKLVAYFENIPKEQLDKDKKEVGYLNEIGSDVEE